MALLGAIVLVTALLAGGARPVQGDGSGSTPPCDTGQGGGAEASVNATDPVTTVNAPAGFVIEYVCIKAGNDTFDGFTMGHSGPLMNGTFGSGCYTVTGVGTSSATITRIGPGPGCAGLSHIDVSWVMATSPTPTATLTPRATNTPMAVAPATGTPPSIPGVVATATPARPAVISPPVTGTGGLAGGSPHGGDSVPWLGLASLLTGLGLVGWARRLSSRR